LDKVIIINILLKNIYYRFGFWMMTFWPVYVFVVLWRYPDLKEEDIAKACPGCCGNCNCKACLQSPALIKVSSAPYRLTILVICCILHLKCDNLVHYRQLKRRKK